MISNEKMPSSNEILHHDEDTIRYITLNRARKANSLTVTMIRQLIYLVDEYSLRAAKIKSVVLLSDGRTFSGGVDLSVFDEQVTSASARNDYLLAWDEMIDNIKASRAPVIAAIQGPAIAGGLSLALACHIRIAAEDAYFSYPRLSAGHPPGRHNLTELVRNAGPSRARLIMLGNRRVSAAEAERWGVIDIVAEKGRLESVVEELVGQIRNTSPELITLTQHLIDNIDDDEIWANAAPAH